ncbi:NAD-dependent epimerase/dehydratase family protein [Halobacillus sp. B29]|uniref:NAD-dependent epimerase/dehydratase family protein n=1 Tax=Halobacillus sp. B29 TaxID=3457432 RepID=UPI003FCD92D0
MKRILITGRNSYIGTRLERWLAEYPEEYSVDFLSVRDNRWQSEDFSRYDVIYHVAGIAHLKEAKKNKALYYKVNRDLAYNIAKKAKEENVTQFIFVSSMSIYGAHKGLLNKGSIPKPKSHYGKSKFQAEELLKNLDDEGFRVAIIRPPMIYGKNCKGNYQKLAKLAVKSPIFPKVNNKRSMIFIDNYSEFIKQIIDDVSKGIFLPQNEKYINVSELVCLISKINGKKIRTTTLFNPLIFLVKSNVVNKIFGNLIYEKKDSNHEKNYCLYNLEESIRLTERDEDIL